MKSPIEGLQIPQHWQIAPISRLADFRRGISWRKQDESPPGEGTLVVSIPNIKDGWIDYQSKFNHYIGIDIPESKLLSEGDVVFVGSSGSIHNVGRNARISQANGNSIAFASFTFRARPDPSVVDSHFFYFLVNSDLVPFQAFCKRAADGKFNFQLGDFSSRLVVPLPPLAEQKAIARDLAAVKRAIEAQERIIQTTTELKQALMQKLFSEGLRGEPQKETEIGLVPESWEVVPLGTLAKVGNGSTPKRSNSTYWDGGTIPWLNSSKIHDIFITEADSFVTPQAVKECHLPKVAPNSLLIAITGQGKTLGNSAITRIETSINQHLAYAQFHDARIVPEFVLWFMQTRYTFLRSIAHGNGSTKGALTCGYLKTLAIPVPSKPEQEAIADTFQIIEERQSIAAKKQIHFRDLFHSLLHILMTAEASVNMFLQP